MVHEMIEKTKNGGVWVPSWVFMVCIPVLITILLAMTSIIQSDASTQAQLKLQAEVNKSGIQELKDKKLDKDAFVIFQSDMTELRKDVKDIKNGLEEHRRTGK